MEGLFFLVSPGCCLQPKGEGLGSVQISVVTAGQRQGQGWYSITLRGNPAPPAQVFSQSGLSLRLSGVREGRPLAAEKHSLLPLLWGLRAASGPHVKCDFPV